jgi:dual specificity phosphatase 12
MYVYKNGIKELISFKNTYATIDERNLLFAKPMKNELYGISLEKGYAISKANNSLQSGYINIIGGSGYQVFETILGTSSEKYKSKHEYFINKQTSYKYIDDEKLKATIKKYIDWGGVITFGIFYNDKSAHEYSLQGYKINKKNEMFLEIINPHRSGGYVEENIYVGPLESVLKIKELLFLKIKFILNLSCVSYNKRIKYFKYYDIFINDNHTENAIKYFKITNRFIEDAVSSGGKILIHSENGTSRCWVFLMAYLIGRKHMTFNQAFELVKSKFSHVEPNDNFLTQLKHYDLKVNI